MMRQTMCALLLGIAASPAFAGPGPLHVDAPSGVEAIGARRTAPVRLKDCTRINGRYGYYGNPFCTEAEQRLWDRATAPRSSHTR